VGAIVILIGTPLAKALGGADWTYGLPVPASVTGPGTTVATSWGAAELKLDEVRAELDLPISMLPWWLVAVLWCYLAVAGVLMLLSVYQVRRIFQRVRDGAPFDAQNAVRLRSVGLFLLAFGLITGLGEFCTALAIRGGLRSSSAISVSSGFHINGPIVLIALGLVALAEIFRRGAELETEQSLVV
jgi:hypothetical protein